MLHINWTRWVDDTDGEHQETDKLPAKWIICPTCNGEGKHSLHLGAITEEDRDRDWSQDEFEDYTLGGYDRRCEDCEGSGKLLMVDDKSCPKALLEAYQSHERCRLEDERADRITAYHESGGSMGSRTGSRW